MGRKRILLVEDMKLTRELVGEALGRDYIVAEAKDGLSAWEMVSGGTQYDMIITDIIMPRMDGFTFLGKIKDSSVTKKTPVMVLTALNDVDSEVQALELGAIDVLSKPFDKRVLKQRVSNLLALSELEKIRSENVILQRKNVLAQYYESTIHTVVEKQYDYLCVVDCPNDKYIMFMGDERDEELPSGGPGYREDMMRYHKLKVVSAEVGRVMKAIEIGTMINSLKREEKATLHAHFVDKQGGIRYKEMQYFYLDKDKELIIITRMDITDSHEQETRQKRKLQTALEVAESANQTKIEFLSHLSSEIKSPLKDVEENLKAWQNKMGQIEKLDEREAERLNDMVAATEHLLEMMQNVLDLSYIERGEFSFQNQYVEWSDFFESLKAEMERLIDGKGITLKCEIPEISCKYGYLDSARLTQVCINVIRSSIQYSSAGNTISFDVKVETGEFQEGILTFVFAVKDEGRIQSRSRLNDTLSPFAENKRDKILKDTELGLFIARELVEIMGGELVVNSLEEGGTETVFILQVMGTQEKEGM